MYFVLLQGIWSCSRLPSCSLSLSSLPLPISPGTSTCMPLARCLDAIKVPTEVVIVQVPLLYVISHLALALAGFLCALKLETVLVHGETHGLGYTRR